MHFAVKFIRELWARFKGSLPGFHGVLRHVLRRVAETVLPVNKGNKDKHGHN